MTLTTIRCPWKMYLEQFRALELDLELEATNKKYKLWVSRTLQGSSGHFIERKLVEPGRQEAIFSFCSSIYSCSFSSITTERYT